MWSLLANLFASLKLNLTEHLRPKQLDNGKLPGSANADSTYEEKGVLSR